MPSSEEFLAQWIKEKYTSGPNIFFLAPEGVVDTLDMIISLATDDDKFELMPLSLNPIIALHYTKERPLWSAIVSVTHLGKLFNVH